MAKLLYLVHRLPYPPNKGDKVRSYNLLKHLAARHEIYLGTFIDDPADAPYIATLRALCADIHVAKLTPRAAKIRSLTGLLTGQPLTLGYYRDARLQAWVTDTCEQQPIEAVVVFCSAMAQYVAPDLNSQSQRPTLIDFVDVDSAKWTQYAPKHHWPLSWLYRREGKTLLAYESDVARRSTRSFFVTEAETNLFKTLAPDCAPQVEAMCNGVDADYFAPAAARPSPYSHDETPIVFTGAMDYWPNVDAVVWFATAVLPLLSQRRTGLRFYIVGRSPTPEVSALANAQIVVTGTVPDVRPYIQHAAAMVAPLRIARGIQNKILEAMAMARPVIASSECAAAVDAIFGQELLTASSPAEYVSALEQLLDDHTLAETMGQAARQRVQQRYSWAAHMSRIDHYLPTTCAP